MDWSKNKPFKIAALICYVLIMLKGSMIYLPLGFWLIFTALEFGNPDQIFALIGCIGLCLSLYTIIKNKITVMLDLLVVILLITPIVRRLCSVNLNAFNYPFFIIPTTLFVVLYALVIRFTASKPNKTV